MNNMGCFQYDFQNERDFTTQQNHLKTLGKNWKCNRKISNGFCNFDTCITVSLCSAFKTFLNILSDNNTVSKISNLQKMFLLIHIKTDTAHLAAVSVILILNENQQVIQNYDK